MPMARNNQEMREQVITNNDIVDGWIEAFGMTLDSDGLYQRTRCRNWRRTAMSYRRTTID
jgi:hypothetical protein